LLDRRLMYEFSGRAGLVKIRSTEKPEL